MSLPIGQLFVFGFEDLTLAPDAANLLSEHNAGGCILFKRNIESYEQVAQLNQQIYANCKEALPIVAVDQEGGRVARLRGICTDVPEMRTIGQQSNQTPKIAFNTAKQMASELMDLGFNLDFAPIMDVDSNPQNPVIGDRSFSSDPYVCATLGSDFIKGMQQTGVAACAKHFPGHGDTNKDSHLELPYLDHNLERLEKLELVPFYAAIKAQVATMMTAHIMLPKIDSSYPATLSKTILTDLLRTKMGYQGVIVSDDLEMQAVADHYAMEDMIELGLNAGVDLFLICHHTEKVHQAISATKTLLTKGKIKQSRIEDALRRVTDLKKTYVKPLRNSQCQNLSAF